MHFEQLRRVLLKRGPRVGGGHRPRALRRRADGRQEGGHAQGQRRAPHGRARRRRREGRASSIRAKNPDLGRRRRASRATSASARWSSTTSRTSARTTSTSTSTRSVSFEGKTGPYVMYSHARACSILANAPAGARCPRREPRPTRRARSRDTTEHALVRLVARVPRPRGRRAVETDDPSQVARAPPRPLRGVPRVPHGGRPRPRAARPHRGPRAARRAPALCTDAVRQTMANGLALLGIAAPPRDVNNGGQAPFFARSAHGNEVARGPACAPLLGGEGGHVGLERVQVVAAELQGRALRLLR